MDHAVLILVFLIGVALLFDFLNGLHDAANSIATIVATRVLPPIYAVGWAAFFNFIAFLFFGLHVADTIGRGIISPDVISDQVIFGALMGAISWNVITWLGGIPSSSSHALIGGLLGAGIAKAGTSAVVIAGVLKTVGAIFMSPAIGFLLALLLLSLRVSGLSVGSADTYKLYAYFDNIAGLTVRSKVTMAGVTIGKVTAIDLDRDSYTGRVTLEIQEDVNILPADSTASILTAGLLGEKYVGISVGGDDEVLKDGDTIQDTQSSLVLEDLIGKFLLNSVNKD